MLAGGVSTGEESDGCIYQSVIFVFTCTDIVDGADMSIDRCL